MAKRLSIIDDMFPLEFSAFRFAEFKAYLDAMPDAQVFCQRSNEMELGQMLRTDETIQKFLQQFPQYEGRVVAVDKGLRKVENDELLYFTFLSHSRLFRHELSFGNPFVFTLYPSGGFLPYDSGTNELLQQTFSLPGFKHVIVTQPFTRQYLLDCKLCSAEQITLIPGLVVPEEFLVSTKSLTEVAGRPGTSEQIKICFVAYKYSDRGREKGFDLFVDIARFLLKNTDAVLEFHIVGGYKPQDVVDESLRKLMIFHEPKLTSELISFFDEMDILISPNRSGEPVPGRFDGFPTGAAVHAGLAGVGIFATDCLQQNYYLIEGEEIVVINNSVSDAGNLIASYIANPVALARLKRKGAQAFRRLYDFQAQMQPRIELLSSMLNGLERHDSHVDEYP